MVAKKNTTSSSLEFIREQLGEEGFVAFCVGSAMKIMVQFADIEDKAEALTLANDYITQALEAMTDPNASKPVAKKTAKTSASAADDTASFAAGGEYNDDGWS